MPCYRCPRRTPGCHAGCSDYQAFHAERESILREQYAKNRIQEGIYAHIQRRAARAVRGRRTG